VSEGRSERERERAKRASEFNLDDEREREEREMHTLLQQKTKTCLFLLRSNKLVENKLLFAPPRD